jgi:XTP/dITP diphosphohydrolase/ATP diphosphatase
VDAEMALRGCNLRFRQRFSEMEKASSKPLEELSPDELEALWAQAKRKLILVPPISPSGWAEPQP